MAMKRKSLGGYNMDLKICGIIDIIIIILALIVMVIGYKKGFMHKVLSFFGFFAVVIVSFAFCTQLAKLLETNQVLFPTIQQNIVNSINNGISSNVEGLPDGATGAQLIQYGMGWPEWLAKMFASAAGVEETTIELMVLDFATIMARISMNVICFVIIFIISYLILGICKIISNCLRGVFIIKFIDGVLGIVLYSAFYVISICILFLILHYMIDASWFASARNFLAVDMQLDTDVFRISKWIYETNPILKLFEMFGLA